jgi:hypothetical protein
MKKSNKIKKLRTKTALGRERVSLAPLSFKDAVSTMLQIKKPREGLTKMKSGKRLKAESGDR